MGYIGRGPVKSGAFRIIDDISSSFNGSTTAFTLQSSSSNLTPITAQNLLIALDGVIQEPGTAFTIQTSITASSTITFASAPASGATFWGVEFGDVGRLDERAVTQSASNNSTKIATTAYTDNAVGGGVSLALVLVLTEVK